MRWNAQQQQLFIDSIFRGYSIPAFHFHKVTTEVRDIRSENLYIVDGQQRINAIHEFKEGAFSLLEPDRFPSFLKDEPCPWAGKQFGELEETLQRAFLEHRVTIFEIVTDNDNEIRDLFIRLQGGTPLSPQDKRDSWPGNFTEFVLKIGGKSRVPKWPGKPLFTEQARISNESQRRQLAAQTFMLVHKDCHPRGDAAVEDFKEWWLSRDMESSGSRRGLPPEGTRIGASLRDQNYSGTIVDRKIVLDQGDEYSSFSAASSTLTGTSRNGWKDWIIQLDPPEGEWIPADDWRQER